MDSKRLNDCFMLKEVLQSNGSLRKNAMSVPLPVKRLADSDKEEGPSYIYFRFLLEILNLITFTIQIYIGLFFGYLFPSESKSLRNEIILITGGATGLGKEISLQLAEMETCLTLIIWDEDEKANENLLKQLRLIGVQTCFAYTVDVGDRKQVEDAAKVLKKQFGYVTMLFCNAEKVETRDVAWELNPENIDKLFQTNVLSYCWLFRELLPTMIDRGHGHIVCTSSHFGFGWGRSMSSYAASKYALTGYIESIKEDIRHHPVNPNIKFTIAYPKVFQTQSDFQFTEEKKYPFLSQTVEPSWVATKIIAGMRRNAEHVYFPALARLEAILIPLLPAPVGRRIADILDL